MACTIPTALCATQEGNLIAVIAFTDSDGNAVTPSSAFWRLVDGDGTVINSRSNVTITPLSTSVEISLEGNDLPWSGDDFGDSYSIYLYLSSTYTEAGIGSVTQTQEVEIQVRQLFGTS